ncbi:MAG TPA: hypothetical protein VGL71_12880 [Urbifossiella sp.]
MGNRWRWRLFGAAVIIVAAALCIGGYERLTAPGGWVRGMYTATSWDGKGTTTLRLNADG